MKNVLILFGGNSYEHEISCKSVNFIIKNIDKKIFKFEVVGIDYNNEWYKIDNVEQIDNNWEKKVNNKIENIIEYIKSFDIVFPMIHGYSGEDGKLQSIFELYNIKYVGCNSLCSLTCYDKLLTKLKVKENNIPQVPYYIYNKKLNLNEIEYPVIIKPSKCGSSLGINVANNKKEFKKAIKIAKKYDNSIIIEKYIKNKRELECSILQYKNKLIISDIGEIINNEVYSYESKYINNTQTIISNIDINIKNNIRKYSKDIFNLLNCKDLSRIDFLYDLDNNKLYFNEINTMPGFTEISMYPKLLKNSGIDSKQLITKLLIK